MKLAVVILNYNGIELLKEFIPKIVKYSTNSKLYLIDNCSSDKSINYVEKNFSHITIIKHAKNLGYAKAYNEGIKKIKTPLIFFNLIKYLSASASFFGRNPAK